MSTHVSLTMIVKNEAATLPACLQSVQGIVDEIIVVDTGSADRTQDIATGHGARVFDFPWCDNFAAARNEAIRHASGDWILWLDADEHLDDANRDKLRTLLANLSDDRAAYAMKCLCLADHRGGSASVVDHVRLFRNHPAVRWDYRVHEQILPALHKAGHCVRPTDILIAHTGYQNPALRHSKLERNLRLLHLDRADRPNDPFTLFNLGWAYADLGRFADAIPLLQHSLSHSQPADSITPKLYALLSQCHRRLGQHEQAWAACQAGSIRCPDDAELLFLKGQLCYQRGDRASARACWTQLLPTDNALPPLPDVVFTSVDAGLRGHLVRHHLAALAREEGNVAEAENHWQAALAEAPAFLPARLGLAELYLQHARWTELEQTLAELQNEPPAAVECAILRARAHLARQEFPAARQLLEDAIRQAPQLLKSYVFLSHVLLQAGDESAAEPLLRQIVGLDPGQVESWRNLAVLLRHRGRLREAIAAAQSGRLHCPHDAELLLLHGVLLQEGGDWINAETCLLHVLEKSTGNGMAGQRREMARNHLADIYLAMGRVREAAAHWRTVLIENPDCAAARRGLAECAAARLAGSPSVR